MKANVPFTVYLQALGGKFLGPNAYNVADIKLTLRIGETDHAIPYPKKPVDDGAISPALTAGSSSFLPILTMLTGTAANPAVSYLTPGLSTVAGTADIDMPANPVFATLNALIPTPQLGPVTLQQYVMLSPDIDSYRINMMVPGLLVNEPVIGAGSISICVRMMCGCKVTTGLPTSFWTPSDFVVTARVHYKNAQTAACQLAPDTTANNSTFIAPVANTADITHISFMAKQISTGNYGTYFY